MCARYYKIKTGYAVHLISTVATIGDYVKCVLCGCATMCVGVLRTARKIIEETLSVYSPTYEKFWQCKRQHH